LYFNGEIYKNSFAEKQVIAWRFPSGYEHPDKNNVKAQVNRTDDEGIHE